MKKYLMMFFVALSLGFQSCDNNDDLWGAIDDLKSRVQALETQVKALNGNVEALKELYSGATISSVTQDAKGDYTLTLSNGETITLTQGSTAEAVIPIIGIDDKGEWQVSIDGGKTWRKLGVQANATDGKTPEFRIDEVTGYWQVRYAATEEFKNVLDSAGQPVKAVGSGTVTDKFFDTVKLEGDMFYVKLLDGTELRVPVVKEFMCSITAPEGVQTFDAGATKRFAVVMKGVANTIVSAPSGWEARITEGNELVVTAPLTGTRATADSRKDVAIIATSTNGFSAIAKILVESNGVAPVPPTIAVAVSTTTVPTAATLSFDVTISADADSWRYIFQKSAEKTDPDAATIATTGTVGSGTTLTINELTSETAYTLYVVAIKNNDPVIYSTVASVEGTTLEMVDLNDLYKTGVTIDGVTYNKDSEGAVLLTIDETTTADVPFQPSLNAQVIFLDDAASKGTYFFTIAVSRSVAADMIIIGRYADKKPKIKVANAAYWGLAGTAGVETTKLAFRGVEIDMTARANYLFNNNNGATNFGYLGFDHCVLTNVTKPIFTIAPNALQYGVRRISLTNNKIKVTATGCQLFSVGATTNYAAYKSIVFDNNVIYGDKEATTYAGQLFNYGNGAAQVGTDWDLAFTVTNNTIVNFAGANVYVKLCSATSLNISKNIFYTTPNYTGNLSLYAFYGGDTSAPVASPVVTLDNKFFGGTANFADYHSNSTVKVGVTNCPKEATSPIELDFTTGVFKSLVEGYGAK